MVISASATTQESASHQPEGLSVDVLSMAAWLSSPDLVTLFKNMAWKVFDAIAVIVVKM